MAVSGGGKTIIYARNWPIRLGYQAGDSNSRIIIQTGIIRERKPGYNPQNRVKPKRKDVDITDRQSIKREDETKFIAQLRLVERLLLSRSSSEHKLNFIKRLLSRFSIPPVAVEYTSQ